MPIIFHFDRVWHQKGLIQKKMLSCENLFRIKPINSITLKSDIFQLAFREKPNEKY